MKNKFKIFLVLLLFVPTTVMACPHIDANGDAHFQLYNEDYTIMTMMYPKDGYLYGKNVPLDEDGGLTVENANNILDETFGFPLKQDKETYYYNYWFTDKDLVNGNWKDKDIKTTVEGLESLTIEGKNFTALVGLPNTLEKSSKFNNDSVTDIYYNLTLKNLRDKELKKYNKLLETYKISNLTDLLLKVSAEYAVTTVDDMQHGYNEVEMDKFYDAINIRVNGNASDKKIVAINLDDDYTENNMIECSYNENSYYSFDVMEPGTYVIVEKPDEIVKPVIERDTKETQKEDKTNYMPLIIGGILILICTVMIFINKKK